jgi:hypothetical protein
VRYEADPRPVAMRILLHRELRDRLDELALSRGQTLTAALHWILCDAFQRPDLRTKIPRSRLAFPVGFDKPLIPKRPPLRGRPRKQHDAKLMAELDRLVAEARKEIPPRGRGRPPSGLKTRMANPEQSAGGVPAA